MSIASPRVFIRMGSHAEKEYVRKTIRFLDGLIIGANLVEATPGATASLMLSVAGAGVPYYIDPMTYVFGSYKDRTTGELRTDLDWIKSEQKIGGGIVRDFKGSYRKLAPRLGYPFQLAVSRGSALSWTDFDDGENTQYACRRVVDYQLNCVADVFYGEPEFKHYAAHIQTPPVVFAPYFYIEPTAATAWTDLGLHLARVTASLGLNVPVHMVVCADSSFLDDDSFLQRIAAEAPKTGVSGVWLWFSRFLEDSADPRQLASLRSLVENLSRDVEVYNLHGGYFSLALCKYGLNGVSHGIGYGEQKDIVPVIGQARPTVRYYVPALRKRLGIPQIEVCFDALGIISPAEFHRQVCGCVVCRGVVAESLKDFSAFGELHLSTPASQRRSQTPAAAKRCRFHFLLSRIRERDELREKPVEQVIEDLDQSWVKWSPQIAISKELRHLQSWRRVLAQ